MPLLEFIRRLLVAGILAGLGTAVAAVKSGDPFPALSGPGMVSLTAGPVPVTTGKVVLVDFWASWCAPCKASFPALAKLQADYGPRGLVVVAVSIDEKPAAAVAFWKKMAAPFAGVHDREQRLVREVAVPAMPTSYLVGSDGRVRAVFEGFHGEESELRLRREIEALLKTP
jgi:thiol-disulfide isomerase/thioredoxin